MAKSHHLLELLQLLILANSWYPGLLTDVEIFFASNKIQFLLIVMFRDVNYCKLFKIVQVYYLKKDRRKKYNTCYYIVPTKKKSEVKRFLKNDT